MKVLKMSLLLVILIAGWVSVGPVLSYILPHGKETFLRNSEAA
jgi:hypothetical protein